MIRAFAFGLVFVAGLTVGTAVGSDGASAETGKRVSGGAILTICGNSPPALGYYDNGSRDTCGSTRSIRVDEQGFVICSRGDGGAP